MVFVHMNSASKWFEAEFVLRINQKSKKGSLEIGQAQPTGTESGQNLLAFAGFNGVGD